MVHFDRRRTALPWKPFHVLVLSLLLTANLGESAWAQAVPAPTQGPEPSDVEGLKERMRDLERTVEDLKRERGSPQGRDSPVASDEARQQPTAGTSTTVPEHHRERGFLRQDHYADPRLDNAPFDPQLRGFFLIPGTQSMLRIGGFARTGLLHHGGG